MTAAAGTSDSRAKRRIQNEQVVAIHAQNKHQLVSKNCVETEDRLRHSLIQSVHFTFYSTDILCVHIGLGANQKLSHWHMTLLGSEHERSSLLKYYALLNAFRKQLYSYGMTPHSIHNFTIATTNSKWCMCFTTEVQAHYIIALTAHTISKGHTLPKPVMFQQTIY